MNLFIDIETLPSQDDQVKADLVAEILANPPGTMSKADTIEAWKREKAPALIEAALLKTSFDGALGSICVIGWAIDDGPTESLNVNARTTEKEILQWFYKELEIKINYQDRPFLRIVGHNHVAFDLPFLRKRSIINQVTPSSHLPVNAKPWDSKVYDTMYQWDPQNRISMDKLCRALGIAGKGDISGADVWPMYQEGRIEEIAEYCRGDVDRTRQMFNRMTFHKVS
jgi:predicted PolB exonuclease-like 3'-5' exonuclease